MEENRMNLQMIAIDNLLLDQENPRLPGLEVEQKDIIINLANYSKGNIISLVQSLSQNGFLDANPLVVMQSPTESGKYLVLDGNRRLCASKILNNPHLVSDTKLFSKAVELMNTAKQEITFLPCSLYESREAANSVIKLAHTGQNQGAGVVPWNPLERERYESLFRPERKSIHHLIDHLLARGVISEADLQKLPLSTLQRIINEKAIREKLGLGPGGTMITPSLSDHTYSVLQAIVSDLSKGKIKVSDVYTSAQQEFYVTQLEDRLRIVHTIGQEENPPVDESILNDQRERIDDTKHQTDYEKSSETEVIIPEDPKSTKKDNQGILPGLLLSNNHNRREIVPKQLSINISDQRIFNIFEELRQLNLTIYTNAVAVLFRVFLELSLESFLKRHPTATPDVGVSYIENLKLKDKMTRSIDYLNKEGKIDVHQTQALHKIADNRDFFNVQLFHMYVHNRFMNPDPDSLRTLWDNLEMFIILLFE